MRQKHKGAFQIVTVGWGAPAGRTRYRSLSHRPKNNAPKDNFFQHITTINFLETITSVWFPIFCFFIFDNGIYAVSFNNVFYLKSV